MCKDGTQSAEKVLFLCVREIYCEGTESVYVGINKPFCHTELFYFMRLYVFDMRMTKVVQTILIPRIHKNGQ